MRLRLCSRKRCARRDSWEMGFAKCGEVERNGPARCGGRIEWIGGSAREGKTARIFPFRVDIIIQSYRARYFEKFGGGKRWSLGSRAKNQAFCWTRQTWQLILPALSHSRVNTLGLSEAFHAVRFGAPDSHLRVEERTHFSKGRLARSDSLTDTVISTVPFLLPVRSKTSHGLCCSA